MPGDLDTSLDGDTDIRPFADADTPISSFCLLDDDETPIVLSTTQSAETSVVSSTALAELSPPSEPLESCGSTVVVTSSAAAAGIELEPQAGHPDPIAVALPWASAAKNRRPLPRPAQLALFAAGSLLILVLASSRCGATTGTSAASTMVVYDDLVVSEELLRKRKEITRDDFAVGPEHRADGLAKLRGLEQAPAAELEEEPAPAAEVLEERRRRRGSNPEDVRSAAGRTRKLVAAPAESASRKLPEGVYRSRISEYDDEDELAKEASATPQNIAVGSVLDARLVRAVTIRRGSETVIASVSGKHLPKGTKVIGRARLDGDVASVRFHKLVLPTGQSVHIDAEAQERGGAGAGLTGSINTTGGRKDSSVAGDVGRGTGRRLVDRMSGGLVGGALSDGANSYSGKSRNSGGARSETTLELAKGKRFQVFLVDGVEFGQ